MTLKAIVDDVSGVPEAARGFYQKIEGDDAGDLAGKFRLTVEGAHGFALDNVETLKSALSSEREAHKTAKSTLKAFEGLDPAKAKAALAKIAKIGDLDPEVHADRLASEKVEAIKTQLMEAAENDRKAWAGREGVLTGELRRVLVDNAAITALGANKGNVELLQRVVTDRLRLTEKDGKFNVEVIDGNGNPRIKDAKGTPMTVEDLVVEMRADKRFAVAFESNAKGGGNTPPGGNDGPAGGVQRYARADWNKKLGEANEAESRKLKADYMAGKIEITG